MVELEREILKKYSIWKRCFSKGSIGKASTISTHIIEDWADANCDCGACHGCQGCNTGPGDGLFLSNVACTGCNSCEGCGTLSQDAQ